MIVFDEEKQEQKLAELRLHEEEELARVLATRAGIPYIDLSNVSIDTDGLRLVPETDAREANIAVFNLHDKKMRVAVLSPEQEKTRTVLESLEDRGYLINLYLASPESLRRAWSRYADLSEASETQAGLFTISFERITELLKQLKTLTDTQQILNEIFATKKASRTTEMLEVILAGALSLAASDIHLEPEETYIRIRYRLDGILTDIIKFNPSVYRFLLSRVKLFSGLKLNVGEAQDGRFTVRVDNTNIEIRTSILPDKQSESVVMRILNPQSIAVPMETLGIEERLLEIITREIHRPNGLLFTTGPTGSGKTTSLYAFLKRVHSPEIKIITIEDPIEYLLPGIVQTQTKDGYSFSNGLRAALRQDPDVIMVGEIRDGETAEIAINAALTGHLVFSTLHTNNAAGTFPRLIDLGINRKVISSAVNMTLAQRLVRKLCEQCRREVPLQGEDRELIEKTVAGIVRSELRPASLDRTWIAGEGCDECNHIGYRGRIGLFEAILVDETIDQIIRTNPSESEIEQAAAPQGILTMPQDGILKVLKGVTSLEELHRAVEFKRK
jgi:type IV pilus assembly protein PilB